jgi:hypothetical protein
MSTRLGQQCTTAVRAALNDLFGKLERDKRLKHL